MNIYPNPNTNFPIVARQVHAILMASLFVISMILVPWGTTAYAADTAVKWHPGHYYGIINSQKDDPKYLKTVYRELNETKALRGLKIPMTWAQLERGKGDYDFRSIDRHLARLAAKNKRLVIVLQTKTFKADQPLIPNYLKTGAYEGGQFPYYSFGDRQKKTKGHNIRLWNANVRNRLIQLTRALGEHYNLHPHFEGIGFDETAMGQPKIAVSSAKKNLFYKNLLVVHERMREHFPNTMTFQYTNFLPNYNLNTFVGKLKNMGAALGNPDVRPGNDPKLKEIYSHYRALSGTMPLVIQVEHNNYLNTRRDGSGHNPTVKELLNYARDNLKTNYIFWARIQSQRDEVLQVLNFSNQKRNPSGGLKSTCPSKYPSCKN